MICHLSSCRKIGFVYGDEILAVDDRRISQVEHLLDAIEKKKVGSAVTLKLQRDGQTRNEKITLAERPAPKALVPFQNQTPPFAFLLLFVKTQTNFV